MKIRISIFFIDFEKAFDGAHYRFANHKTRQQKHQTYRQALLEANNYYWKQERIFDN